MTAALRLVGFVLLVVLPGGWVTFGLRLDQLRFCARLLVGATLTPLVVLVQFYLLRLLGLPFELVPASLLALNLPVLVLIHRNARGLSFSEACVGLPGMLAVMLIPLACLVPQLLDFGARVYSGHAWMHTDIVYRIAGGELLLEDPELAGISLSYPWAGHVYQALLSHLLDSSPPASFIWTNLAWLLLAAGLLSEIGGELGGRRLFRLASLVWLFFGVNLVGYTLRHALPDDVARSFPIWGDYRYTPWVWKFLFFNQMPLALGMFTALVLLTIARARTPSRPAPRAHVATVGLLLAGIGIVYPLLFPPAAAVLLAGGVALVLTAPEGGRLAALRRFLPYLAALAMAGGATLAQLLLLGQDRTTSGVLLSEPRPLVRKILEGALVTSPLLAAAALGLTTRWRSGRAPVLTLLLSALGSYLLYVLFHIPHWRGEYKFIFTAAICLAPFATLALESVAARRPRLTLPLLGATSLVLAAPFAHKVYTDPPWVRFERPRVTLSSFDLRLSEDEPFSELCDVIRRRTPANSILLVESTELHFPTLTRRRLYVPPLREEPHPGVNLTSDHLLKNVKGYGREILIERRRVLSDLFEASDAARLEAALAEVLAFDRPLLILLDKRRHDRQLRWLREGGSGRPLHEQDELVLWSIDARRDGALHARSRRPGEKR